MKRKILAAAFGTTVALTVFTMTRNQTETAISEATVRAGTTSKTKVHFGENVPLTPGTAPTTSTDELARDPLVESDSNPFKIVSFLPPPPEVPPPPPLAPAPKPSAPPFPYKYFGKMTGTDGKPVTYLTRGDEVIPVHKQEILDNTYRIDAIGETAITVTYLPLDARSDVPIQTAAQ